MQVRTQPIPVVGWTTAPRGNGFAVASIVFAVLGLVVGIVPLFIGLILSFVPAILGLVFGLVAFVRSFSGRTGRSLAVAGFAVALLTMVLWVHGYGIVW